MADILGIDVGKSQLHLVLLQDGKPPARKSVENTFRGFEQVNAWLRNRKASEVHACLEATGHYGEAIAEHLYDCGHTVSVVNPIQIKAFGRSAMVRTKTDSVDALLIAQFCQAHAPVRWAPPPREIREFRAFLRRRETLTQMITAETNRLDSAATDVVRRSIGEHVAFLRAQLKALQDDIDDHLDSHPGIKDSIERLDEIPGFGSLTAIKVVAETNGFSVCGSARELIAYAGLNPRHYQSGTISRRGRISKVGNAALRKALYYAALVAKNRAAYFRPFVERLRAAGKPPKIIITAIMRKLLVLAHSLMRTGARFDPAFTP